MLARLVSHAASLLLYELLLYARMARRRNTQNFEIALLLFLLVLFPLHAVRTVVDSDIVVDFITVLIVLRVELFEKFHYPIDVIVGAGIFVNRHTYAHTLA